MNLFGEIRLENRRGYEIVSMPPPLLVESSGSNVEHVGACDLGTMGFGVSETVHLMIEAQRRLMLIGPSTLVTQISILSLLKS